MSNLYILKGKEGPNKDRYVLRWNNHYFLAWGSLDECVYQMVDCIAQEFPGYIETIRKDRNRIYQEVMEYYQSENKHRNPGEIEDLAWQKACEGYTLLGNCSDAIYTLDWGVTWNNPSRAALNDWIKSHPRLKVIVF